MPEKLDDGCHIALIFRNYLVFAPQEGPLFQKTTPAGAWSGKAWSASTITDKLRKALANPSVGLSWSNSQIHRFSAHSFRAGAATEMASGQVSATMVAKALHHHGSTVTSRSYINPTDSHIRSNLSVTGTQPLHSHSHSGLF